MYQGLRRGGSRRFPTTAGALAVAGLAVLYWRWRVVGSARAPGPIGIANGDLYEAYLPVHWFAYRSAELVPLWNPHQLAGTPFLANANGVLYPPNFLAMLLPVGQALGHLGAFHLALAGCGAFLSARALSLSTVASLLAGATFLLSGNLVAARVHPSHLAGHAWVPWIAWAVGRLLASPSSGRATLLGALLAVQLLTGSSQMSVYTIYALLLAVAVYLGASRDRNAGQIVHLAAFVALALVVAGGLAALQIVPTLTLVWEGGRQQLPVQATQSDAPALATARALFAGGSGVCLLAALALGDRRRRAVVWTALVVLAVTLLIGFGTPAYSLAFHHMPGVDRFRAPARILVISQLALAILAAIGLDALIATRTDRRKLALATLLLACGVFGMDSWLSEQRGTARALSVGGLATAAVFAGSLRSLRARRAAAGVALAIVVSGRLGANPGRMTMPLHNPESFFAPPPFAGFLSERSGHDRVLIVRGEHAHYPLMAKAGTLFGLRVVQDYEPLAPRIYWDVRSALGASEIGSASFWGALAPEELGERWRSLDLMATRYLVVGAKARWPERLGDRLLLRFDDGSVRVFENRDSLPRAYLVDRADVLPERVAALARLRDPSFDPRDRVVLEAAPEGRPASSPRSPSEGGGQERSSPVGIFAEGISIAEPSPDEVVVRVRTPRPAFLVLTDLFWPGWTVTVDGRPERMLRANVLFRAVPLEPGAHEVRFVYEPWEVRAGGMITLGAVALVLGQSVLALARRGRGSQSIRM